MVLTLRGSYLVLLFIVFAATGFLYLAVNRQGTIVYNLPYMPPVIDRVIFQLAAALEFFEHHLADIRKWSLTLPT